MVTDRATSAGDDAERSAFALELVQPTTPRQVARRDGAIRAAIELASEGGYEAVRMRDVAARADIALGTLYRYFSSKDHLLAAAMAVWSTAGSTSRSDGSAPRSCKSTMTSAYGSTLRRCGQ